MPHASDRVPRRRGGVGLRTAVLGAIALAGLWAAVHLGLAPTGLVPGPGGLALAGELFSRALSPALTYESDVPAGTVPLLWKALEAARVTVVLAAAALSLSVVAGFVLSFAASASTWVGLSSRTAGGGTRSAFRRLPRLSALVPPAVYGLARAFIALLRSVHELLWAVLFLAAFGVGQFSAVLAIAIPYSGTLAKVFSEMLDEAPRDAADALRSAGASPAQVFLFGLLPRALPDMTAYAFYRFECALRSSAVLGFFGYPTLGYYLAASFENLHYGEVWTYLYTLLGLVILADAWSGALRRRLVPGSVR